MLRIIKGVLARNTRFYAPDTPPNQEVNFDVISNVMTFLNSLLKFRQSIVSKDHISLINGDNFMKFAG